MEAAMYGHIEVLQWAVSNGCPYEIHKLCRDSNVKNWINAGVLKL
jgi:hypothetical protein